MLYLEVVIDEKLQFTIIVFGWLLPNWHALYENHSRSVQAVTVSNLLREIMNHELCPGLPLEPKAMQGDKVISRVIPWHIDLKFSSIYRSQRKCLVEMNDVLFFVWIVIYTINVDCCSKKSKHLRTETIWVSATLRILILRTMINGYALPYNIVIRHGFL